EQGEAAGNKLYAEQEYAKNLQAANAILARYKMTCTGDLSAFADKLAADYAEIKRLQGEIAEWNIKAEDFKIKNNLAERPEQQKTDGDMNAKLAAFRKRLAVVENEIADSEAKVEKLDGLTASLEEKKERLENYLKRYALLDGTVTLLKKAEQNLKDKYISPVENSFLRYSDMIERALGEKVLMDSDFNIYFERGGEARSDRHLSSGQRSVCGLCFRLALIDNMYTEEKPFIIMDDPFVNVDDEHFEKTARLVKELSRGKQIVYFCCHSSRSLNG
ncbi:MAG: hypothetical protein LUD27_01550, partial [Clostridia bacterium]|nr:hypothetical protein [Clostridia bacterium]